MKKILSIILLVIFSLPIFAQTEALSDTIKYEESIYIPDRPGYSFNAHLVGLHQMDIEIGFGYQYMNYGEKTNIFYNSVYMRYGAFKHLEFRYGVDFGSITTTYNNSGVRGVNIGFKVPIITGIKNAPDIAIVAYTYLPNIGIPEFAIPDYAPAATLAVQKCFFDRLVLFGNAGFYYDGFNPYAQYNASLSAYYFITDKCAIFAETNCLYSDRNNPNNMGDVGMIFYVTDNIQWDLSFGINYVKGFDNSFINSGISWRIPKHRNITCKK